MTDTAPTRTILSPRPNVDMMPCIDAGEHQRAQRHRRAECHTETKTIYTSTTETRTFAVGEVVDYFIGTSRYAARIVSFDGGIFHFTIGASPEVHLALGAVFAKALAPHRRNIEVNRLGW